MVFIVLGYLKIAKPFEENEHVETAHEAESDDTKLLTKNFWIVLISFFAMIVVWIVTDQERIPLLLPPLLLIAFYSLPQLGFVTNQMIREFDWENFLLLGTSFSIGLLLATNGTADVLASILIGFIPENSHMIVKVIIFACIVFVLRFFFIVPSSAVIVIFPIVISYSELIGIPPIQLSLLIFVIIGSMMILPIHTPTVFLAFETGVISRRGQTIIGLLSSFVFMTIGILSALYYW